MLPILFATQAGTCPPRFVLFTTGSLDPGYQRFVERKLREEFGFAGSPIEVSVRLRKQTGPGGRGKTHGEAPPPLPPRPCTSPILQLWCRA